MSSMVIVMPADVWHVPPPPEQRAACAYLELLDGYSGKEHVIELEDGPHIHFGVASLDQIICPNCSARLDQDWFFAQCNPKWDIDLGYFADLRVVMPCCGHATDLNSLEFPVPGDETKPRSLWRPARTVGFARFTISTWNAPPLSLEELGAVESALLCLVFQVCKSF